MAKTYHNERDRNAALRRGELVGIIGNACRFEDEWERIHRTVIPSRRIDSGVAEVACMVARCGASICRQVIRLAVAGLQELERGEFAKAEHALRLCKRLIRADITASVILGKLIGNQEVPRA